MADLYLRRPGAAWLLIELPIGVGDRFRIHQALGIEIGERLFAFICLDAFANPLRVDAGIDDEMGDMEVLRPKLARRGLCHSTQAELGAGECREADAAAQARRRA